MPSTGSGGFSTVGATKEPGEPDHAGNPGGHSVWFRWTPATNGTYTISIDGNNFDTLLAVYTGSALDALTAIAANDDISATDTASSVTFHAQGGTTYDVAVDGKDGASGLGEIVFSRVSPWNDDFESAFPLGANSTGVPFDTTNATLEPGEPEILGNPGGHSVWFTWTPDTTQTAVITTQSTSFDPQLAVYTGSSLDALTLVGASDDISAIDRESRVIFTAQAGTTYDITVDGKDGASGTGYLDMSPARCDSFELACAFFYPEEDTTAATREPGEPEISGNPGGHSIWETWSPSFAGEYTISTEGSDFDTLLGAFTGSSLSTLVPVAENDDISATDHASAITVAVTQPIEYDIAVDGHDGASGNAHVTITPPANPGDDFANAYFLGSSTSGFSGSTAGMTKEPGEPDHQGNPGGHSVWYRWTVPATQKYELEVDGTATPLIGVYTGSSIDALTPVDGTYPTPASTSQDLFDFTAVAGTTYDIAVDGRDGTSGPFTASFVPLDDGTAAVTLESLQAPADLKLGDGITATWRISGTGRTSLQFLATGVGTGWRSTEPLWPDWWEAGGTLHDGGDAITTCASGCPVFPGEIKVHFIATAPGPYSIVAKVNSSLSTAVAGTVTCDVTGTPGDDVLRGTQGKVQSLCGGDGNDTFENLSPGDVVFGGPGNDTIESTVEALFVDGGPGTDTISYASAPGPVHVWLDGGIAQRTGAGNDVLVNIENVVGSAHGDYIAGDGATTRLSGGGGNDQIVSGAGVEKLSGGAGNDKFRTKDGAIDRVSGGRGSDVDLADPFDHLLSTGRVSRAPFPLRQPK